MKSRFTFEEHNKAIENFEPIPKIDKEEIIEICREIRDLRHIIETRIPRVYESIRQDKLIDKEMFDSWLRCLELKHEEIKALIDGKVKYLKTFRFTDNEIREWGWGVEPK